MHMELRSLRGTVAAEHFPRANVAKLGKHLFQEFNVITHDASESSVYSRFSRITRDINFTCYALIQKI